MNRLFATTVTNAKPRDRDYKLTDGDGLFLLVRPNGSKLWRMNYKYLGRYRTLAFGSWPHSSPICWGDGKARASHRLLCA